ncbi:MAG: isochorismatase family protein [Oliverpabstia sp.]
MRQAARKADRIILTGVVSECCVLSTFFEGIDLGCKLIWLTDATSEAPEPDPAEAKPQHILQGLSPLHVEFMTTEEYLTQQS